MPASTSAREARQIGSFLYELTAGAPRLMLTMRMLYLSLLRGFPELTGLVGSTGLSIQLSALRSTEVLPLPFASRTRRLMMLAFGATPSYAVPSFVLVPAADDATCVPCPKGSMVGRFSVVKSLLNFMFPWNAL